MDRGADDDTGSKGRVSSVPTFVWMMLGVLLVLVFIALLFFVFHAPPSWKADRSVEPPQVTQGPSSTAPTPMSSEVSG